MWPDDRSEAATRALPARYHPHHGFEGPPPCQTPSSCKSLTKTFGDTVAVRDLDLVVPAGRALRRHRPERRGQDDDDPHDPVDPVPRPRRGVHPRAPRRRSRRRTGSATCPRSAASTRRCGCGAVPRLHGVAEGRRRRRPRAARRRRGSSASTWASARDKRCEELSKGMQQKVQFAGGDHPPARPADPRRAVQRPRSRSTSACCATWCSRSTGAAPRSCSRRTS